MNKHTELYETLDVSPDANHTDIKKAYRKKVLTCHPDKSSDDLSKEKFQQVQQAYDILSDPKKRDIYDKFGIDAATGTNQPDMSGSGFPFGPGFPFGFPGYHQHHQQHQHHQHHSHHPIQPEKILKHITLKEIFCQEQVEIEHQRHIMCDVCVATGFSDGKAHLCAKCKGTGTVTQIFRNGYSVYQNQMGCDVCKGGKKELSAIKTLLCGTCSGSGKISSVDKIKVDIPKNIMEVNHVCLSGQGSWDSNSGICADLIVMFEFELDPIKNQGYGVAPNKKITYTMNINLPETLCGFVRTFDHPSGKKICIESDVGTVINPFMSYVIDGLGFGNEELYLIFDIKYPDSIVIPDSKRLAFTYGNLEKILGEKLEKDYDFVEGDPIFNLSNLRRVTVNSLDLEHEDVHEHGHEHTNPNFQGVECAQQ